MDAYQTFELVLSCVKNSNLNFLLSESPFSASITIRKSFIKNKNGCARHPNISASSPQEQVIEENKMLNNEVNSLKDTIKQHEGEINSLRNTITELENDYKDKETEVGDLRDELACSKEKTVELETRDKEYVCELDEVAEELYKTKVELTKQYENLRTKNKEIDKLKKANKHFKTEQKVRTPNFFARFVTKNLNMKEHLMIM